MKDNRARFRLGAAIFAIAVVGISVPWLSAADPPTGTPPPTDIHGAPTDYTSMLFVLMLATFIGLGVITRVSRLLHTPLMSLTNAISAIAVVGAIVVAGGGNHSGFITFLGGVALFASVTNIVSGFLITDRMLKMFKQRERGQP